MIMLDNDRLRKRTAGGLNYCGVLGRKCRLELIVVSLEFGIKECLSDEMLKKLLRLQTSKSTKYPQCCLFVSSSAINHCVVEFFIYTIIMERFH